MVIAGTVGRIISQPPDQRFVERRIKGYIAWGPLVQGETDQPPRWPFRTFAEFPSIDEGKPLCVHQTQKGKNVSKGVRSYLDIRSKRGSSYRGTSRTRPWETSRSCQIAESRAWRR